MYLILYCQISFPNKISQVREYKIIFNSYQSLKIFTIAGRNLRNSEYNKFKNYTSVEIIYNNIYKVKNR